MVIEVRLSWNDPLVFRGDLALREELTRRGIDPRTMVCRRDDETREFVFKGETTIPAATP